MRTRFLTVLIVLGLAAAACRLGTSASQRPGSEIPISTEEAQLFEQNLKAASEAYASTGTLDVQISETQLTSYMYFQLQEQANSGISDPQIYLRDGKIQMYAAYSESALPVDLVLVITPKAADGRITLQLDSVHLGPAAAPQLLVDRAQQIITEQLEPGLNESVASGLYVDNLSVADGTLTLQGKKP